MATCQASVTVRVLLVRNRDDVTVFLWCKTGRREDDVKDLLSCHLGLRAQAFERVVSKAGSGGS